MTNLEWLAENNTWGQEIDKRTAPYGPFRAVWRESEWQDAQQWIHTHAPETRRKVREIVLGEDSLGQFLAIKEIELD